MSSPLDNMVAASSRQPTRQWWVLWRYWLLREFKTRYAGSVLGVAWAFVQPLATLAIFYVLFGLVLAVRVPGLDVNNGYLLHLLAGLAVWLPFTDALGRGVGSLAAYEDFLRKQPMPAEILPAVSVGGSLLVHGIAPIEHWVASSIVPQGGVVAAVVPTLVHVVVGAVIGGAVVLCIEAWHKLRGGAH